MRRIEHGNYDTTGLDSTCPLGFVIPDVPSDSEVLWIGNTVCAEACMSAIDTQSTWKFNIFLVSTILYFSLASLLFLIGTFCAASVLQNKRISTFNQAIIFYSLMSNCVMLYAVAGGTVESLEDKFCRNNAAALTQADIDSPFCFLQGAILSYCSMAQLLCWFAQILTIYLDLIWHHPGTCKRYWRSYWGAILLIPLFPVLYMLSEGYYGYGYGNTYCFKSKFAPADIDVWLMTIPAISIMVVGLVLFGNVAYKLAGVYKANSLLVGRGEAEVPLNSVSSTLSEGPVPSYNLLTRLGYLGAVESQSLADDSILQDEHSNGVYVYRLLGRQGQLIAPSDSSPSLMKGQCRVEGGCVEGGGGTTTGTGIPASLNVPVDAHASASDVCDGTEKSSTHTFSARGDIEGGGVTGKSFSNDPSEVSNSSFRAEPGLAVAASVVMTELPPLVEEDSGHFTVSVHANHQVAPAPAPHQVAPAPVPAPQSGTIPSLAAPGDSAITANSAGQTEVPQSQSQSMQAPWYVKLWVCWLPERDSKDDYQLMQSQKFSAITSSLSFVLAMVVAMGGYVAGRMYYFSKNNYTDTTYNHWIACYFGAYYTSYTAAIGDMVEADSENQNQNSGGSGRTYEEFYYDAPLRDEFAQNACGDSADTRTNHSMGDSLLIFWYFLSICGQGLFVSAVLIRSSDVRAFFSKRWWIIVARITLLLGVVIVEVLYMAADSLRSSFVHNGSEV